MLALRLTVRLQQHHNLARERPQSIGFRGGQDAGPAVENT
jgi:hypothetical protein